MNPRLPFLFLLLLGCFAPLLNAQWQATTYTLRGGWNGIWLHGDMPQGDLQTIFANHPEVLEVWRWNPNPTTVQFQQSPQIPAPGTAEWSRWQRSAPEAATLGQLTGQAGYLVRCAGASSNTYSVTLLQRVLPPSNVWVRNGATLAGFPTRLNGSLYPTFSQYFATFPVAIAANARIFRYVGGDLGPGNPMQVFSPTMDRVDRTQAYWFEAPTVGNFYAPLEVTSLDPDGLDFGRTGSTRTVRLRNRGTAALTVTLARVASAAAPANQPLVTGQVPLTRIVPNLATGEITETMLAPSTTATLAAGASVDVIFGLDRSQVTGTGDAFYASLLRVTDSANLVDIYLPVSAAVTSLAGLWIGDVSVIQVESKAPGSAGTSTVRPFPLRVLLHIDDAGDARLLSQVFMGPLASTGEVGLTTSEALLKAEEKAGATRYVATHLPLDGRWAGTGEARVALGQTWETVVTVPYDDPTNPFVHTYHPDHDNRDARGARLLKDVESYEIVRTCRFTFTPAPPEGGVVPGWGATILGGTYTEVIRGLHKAPLTVSGTFQLRRASELGTLRLP